MRTLDSISSGRDDILQSQDLQQRLLMIAIWQG
jgi:hypothetical protein